MKTLVKILWALILIQIFPSIVYPQTIENSYTVNQEVPIGGFSLFYVPISDVPSNAVISNIEVKFDYIAYGIVQNYVSIHQWLFTSSITMFAKLPEKKKNPL